MLDIKYTYGPFFWVIVILLLFSYVSIDSWRGIEGSTTGYVVAVEHQDNMIWDSDIVRIAVNNQVYDFCVTNPGVKADFTDLTMRPVLITVFYDSDFITWKSECNGGLSTVVNYYKIGIPN
jgi:hypothetical protein